MTTGVSWIFAIPELNDNGEGGPYFQSYAISLIESSSPYSSSGHQGDVFATIAHWVNCPRLSLKCLFAFAPRRLKNSYSELGDDDYLTSSESNNLPRLWAKMNLLYLYNANPSL